MRTKLVPVPETEILLECHRKIGFEPEEIDVTALQRGDLVFPGNGEIEYVPCVRVVEYYGFAEDWNDSIGEPRYSSDYVISYRYQPLVRAGDDAFTFGDTALAIRNPLEMGHRINPLPVVDELGAREHGSRDWWRRPRLQKETAECKSADPGISSVNGGSDE